MVIATIYVALLNEGVDCWRPVEASLQEDGTYLIVGVMPDEEEWAFEPGAVVYCEPKQFAGAEFGLAAVRRAG